MFKKAENNNFYFTLFSRCVYSISIKLDPFKYLLAYQPQHVLNQSVQDFCFKSTERQKQTIVLQWSISRELSTNDSEWRKIFRWICIQGEKNFVNCFMHILNSWYIGFKSAFTVFFWTVVVKYTFTVRGGEERRVESEWNTVY